MSLPKSKLVVPSLQYSKQSSLKKCKENQERYRVQNQITRKLIIKRPNANPSANNKYPQSDKS